MKAAKEPRGGENILAPSELANTEVGARGTSHVRPHFRAKRSAWVVKERLVGQGLSIFLFSTGFS